MTSQRRVILEELRKLKTHPTAAELYEIVRQRLPRISLGTVYRNLDILSRCGAISKLVVSDSQCRFDGDVSDHYHIRCTTCGRVDDVTDLPGDWAKACPNTLAGYTLTGYRLEFLGLCPACEEKRTTQGAYHGQTEG